MAELIPPEPTPTPPVEEIPTPTPSAEGALASPTPTPALRIVVENFRGINKAELVVEKFPVAVVGYCTSSLAEAVYLGLTAPQFIDAIGLVSPFWVLLRRSEPYDPSALVHAGAPYARILVQKPEGSVEVRIYATTPQEFQSEALALENQLAPVLLSLAPPPTALPLEAQLYVEPRRAYLFALRNGTLENAAFLLSVWSQYYALKQKGARANVAFADPAIALSKYASVALAAAGESSSVRLRYAYATPRGAEVWPYVVARGTALPLSTLAYHEKVRIVLETILSLSADYYLVLDPDEAKEWQEFAKKLSSLPAIVFTHDEDVGNAVGNVVHFSC